MSGQQHMTITLIRNFLNFINKIKQSPKPILRHLYNISKADVRTTTGSNLRNILLQTSLSSVDDLQPGIVQQLKYSSTRRSRTGTCGGSKKSAPGCGYNMYKNGKHRFLQIWQNYIVNWRKSNMYLNKHSFRNKRAYR